jgi:hypothetical protein
MTVSDMCLISGYSRQRLNKLVKLGHARGCRRKPNDRLEIFDKALATRWCKSLRQRKERRRQNNEARKEWRDRIKIRKSISLTRTMPTLMQKALSALTPTIQSDLEKRIKDPRLEQWGDFLAHAIAKFVIYQATDPIGIARASFAIRGRNDAMREARGMLFDFSMAPQIVPHIRSYADIAREYGCSRAAISAAAKQLPKQGAKRGGRGYDQN